jgi:hypothetical protein
VDRSSGAALRALKGIVFTFAPFADTAAPPMRDREGPPSDMPPSVATRNVVIVAPVGGPPAGMKSTIVRSDEPRYVAGYLGFLTSQRRPEWSETCSDRSKGIAKVMRGLSWGDICRHGTCVCGRRLPLPGYVLLQLQSSRKERARTLWRSWVPRRVVESACNWRNRGARCTSEEMASRLRKPGRGAIHRAKEGTTLALLTERTCGALPWNHNVGEHHTHSALDQHMHGFQNNINDSSERWFAPRTP